MCNLLKSIKSFFCSSKEKPICSVLDPQINESLKQLDKNCSYGWSVFIAIVFLLLLFVVVAMSFCVLISSFQIMYNNKIYVLFFIIVMGIIVILIMLRRLFGFVILNSDKKNRRAQVLLELEKNVLSREPVIIQHNVMIDIAYRECLIHLTNVEEQIKYENVTTEQKTIAEREMNMALDSFNKLFNIKLLYNNLNVKEKLSAILEKRMLSEETQIKVTDILNKFS